MRVCVSRSLSLSLSYAIYFESSFWAWAPVPHLLTSCFPTLGLLHIGRRTHDVVGQFVELVKLAINFGTDAMNFPLFLP